jgi:hypothetical protein
MCSRVIGRVSEALNTCDPVEVKVGVPEAVRACSHVGGNAEEGRKTAELR